jgi:UDP-glucuronate 4-epimerase
VSLYVVTGAAGFIGSNVVECLLKQGHKVLGIDNLSNAYDTRLKHWRLARLRQHSGFECVPVDIANRQRLHDALHRIPQPEAIINLAACAGVRQSVLNPWIYIDTNATGTLNLLEYCRAMGVRRFLLASTSSLYGSHNPMPYQEDADTSRPLSPYAASKKAAEAMCHSYHHLYGIDVTVFRYFTVYGPSGRPDMSVFRFVQWITEGYPVTLYGDGNQSRDFTYVEDIARGTVAGLALKGFNTINLGSDKPVRLIEILRLIEQLTGRQAVIDFQPVHSADVSATWADITKARELLGWAPETSYQQGVEKAVQWYMDNREWAKDIVTADIVTADVPKAESAMSASLTH